MTSTSPAALPVPPAPPTLMSSELSVPLAWMCAPTTAPPTPPPPPIDCARMPNERSPTVAMVPVLVAETSPAVAPLPPLPPTATLTVVAALSLPGLRSSRSSVIACPPAPPPPPSDWARIPSESSPPVMTSASLVTVTLSDTAPEPPPPPTAMASAPASWKMMLVTPPPMPPSPPIDCAAIPRERSPSVLMSAWLPTVTVPDLPPAPPSRPTASEPEKLLALSPVPLRPDPEIELDPLVPPAPPVDWARMPDESLPWVMIVSSAVTRTLPAMPPVPPSRPMPICSLFLASSAGAMLIAALPPPPASDWAVMPFDWSPCVSI